MATVRRNTLVVDFSVLPVKPNAADIEKFLRNNLEIEMASIKNLQCHTIRNCTFIEMRDIVAAERVASMHHLKHSMAAGGKNFNIPVYVEDAATNVRIHDLPPGMSNEVVAEHMKAYGKIKSVARELWKKFFPGIPNGVRVVRIELDKHIPSFIRIQGQLTAVSYKSQIPTCRKCGRTAHPKQKCSAAAAHKKKREEETMELPNVASVQQKQEATNSIHSVADNPEPDVTIDISTEQVAERSNKRQQRSNSHPVSSCEFNPPPQKKSTVEARDPADDDDEMETTVCVDSDSDSGPDPDRGDVDGWILKFKKRSKRTAKFIAKLK